MLLRHKSTGVTVSVADERADEFAGGMWEAVKKTAAKRTAAKPAAKDEETEK